MYLKPSSSLAQNIASASGCLPVPFPSSSPSPSSRCSVTATLTARISHILPPLAEHPSDFFHQADAYAFFRSQLKCLVLRVSSSTLWIRHFFLLS